MIRLISQFFTCPRFHHPLFAITPDGIEVKCKHCKQTHFIGRSHIEQAWSELARAETKPLQAVRV